MKHRILPAIPALGLGLFLCGAALTDPYRWLENAGDPAVQKWSAAHDKRARGYLDALPYRKAIYDRLYQQLSASSASYYSIAVASGTTAIDWFVPSPDGRLLAV